MPANLVPLFPSIKSGLGLSNAEFGFAIAAGPIGALSSGLLAGMLIRRFRSSRVAVVGMIVASFCALLAGIAPSWALLATALFLLGAMDSVADVAQNSHGLRVQRRYGRSILNSFHAIWSVGAVLGALMGGAAAGLGIPIAVHLSISAAIFATVNLIGYRFLLPGPEPVQVVTPAVGAAVSGGGGGTPIRWATWTTLIALGLIAVCGSIVEDSGGTWSAVYLSGSLGAGATVAGFGIATLVPSAMHAADELPGFLAGTGLTLLSWMMRLRFSAGPTGDRADRRRDVIEGCAAVGPIGGARRRRAVAAPGPRHHRSAQGFRCLVAREVRAGRH